MTIGSAAERKERGEGMFRFVDGKASRGTRAVNKSSSRDVLDLPGCCRARLRVVLPGDLFFVPEGLLLGAFCLAAEVVHAGLMVRQRQLLLCSGLCRAAQSSCTYKRGYSGNGAHEKRFLDVLGSGRV